ncbi:hypothetical protein LNO36_12045 [Klebsiella variicola subsp. variicola]|nr:hypothetical protein [Klebsiella variicola subsp. variicola]
MRDAFFIKALYFKENSFHTRGMDNEQIRFIKELPNQYTDWLRVKSTILRGRYYFSIHDVISFLFTIIHLIEINSQEQNLAILFTPNQYHQLHKKLRIRETYAISA